MHCLEGGADCNPCGGWWLYLCKISEGLFYSVHTVYVLHTIVNYYHAITLVKALRCLATSRNFSLFSTHSWHESSRARICDIQEMLFKMDGRCASVGLFIHWSEVPAVDVDTPMELLISADHAENLYSSILVLHGT